VSAGLHGQSTRVPASTRHATAPWAGSTCTWSVRTYLYNAPRHLARVRSHSTSRGHPLRTLRRVGAKPLSRYRAHNQCAHLSGAWDGTSINVPTYQGLGMVPRSMCPPIRGVGWYLDQCAHLSGAWDGTVLRGKYTYDVKADLKWVVAAIRGANLAKEPWKSNAYFCGILPPAGTASLLSP